MHFKREIWKNREKCDKFQEQYSMISTKEKGDMKEKIVKGIAFLLTMVIKLNANSVSCYWAYQPKQPEAIKKFQKVK